MTPIGFGFGFGFGMTRRGTFDGRKFKYRDGCSSTVFSVPSGSSNRTVGFGFEANQRQGRGDSEVGYLVPKVEEILTELYVPHLSLSS